MSATFSTSLIEDVIPYVIIQPRRRVEETWAHWGTSSQGEEVYSAPFDLGYVESLVVNFLTGPLSGDAISYTTQAASVADIDTDEFYFDRDTETLYIAHDPANGDLSDLTETFITITYELYFSNRGIVHGRVPTSSSSAQVFYSGTLMELPTTTQGSTDLLFGFLPETSGSLTLANTEHDWERHLFDSSFSNAKVSIYLRHAVNGIFQTAHFVTGQIRSIQYDQSSVSFSLFDPIAVYNEPVLTQTYSSDDFPSIDPNFDTGSDYIRRVFGVVSGFVPVNLDYAQDSPTTSDNRDWGAVLQGTSMTGVALVQSGSTSTRTKILSSQVSQFRVGDSVWMDRVSGTDEYVRVTAVGADYIDHASLSGGAMVADDIVRRSYVSMIDIVQDGVHYYPLFGRDYTEATFGGTVMGISFTTSMESNVGMPATLKPSDRVTFRVYGYVPAGSSFNRTTFDSEVILEFFAKKFFSNNPVDATLINFSGASNIGFSIPKSAHDDSPTYKDVLIELLNTTLSRIYQSDKDEFAIKQIQPATGVPSFAVDENEYLQGSLSYEFNYEELASQIIIQYARQEISSFAQAETAESFSSVSSVSHQASLLHGVNNTKVFQSLHIDSSGAQTYADQLAAIFGERRGLLSMNLRSNPTYSISFPGDVFQINQTRLPGFEYDGVTLREKDYAAVEINRTIRNAVIILDDQKGIEDNSSLF